MSLWEKNTLRDELHQLDLYFLINMSYLLNTSYVQSILAGFGIWKSNSEFNQAEMCLK